MGATPQAEIEIKDLYMQKQDLLLEIHKLEDIINALNVKIASLPKVANEVDRMKEQIELWRKEKQTIDKNIEIQNDEKIKEEQRMKTVIEACASELKDLGKKVKDANKELGWVNDKILKGDEDIKKLIATKKAFDDKIKELSLVAVNYEVIKKEYEDLEAVRLFTINSIKELNHESSVSLNNHKSELAELERLKEVSIQARNKAEYETKSYVDGLSDAMNDFQVVKSRLKAQFSEEFPELRFPM